MVNSAERHLLLGVDLLPRTRTRKGKVMSSTTSRLGILLVFVVAVMVTGCMSVASAAEYRAFWVDAWGAGVLSQAQVDTLLGVAGNGSSLGQIRQANCNTVIVQVRRNCDANYPSSMGEPYMSGLSPAQFNSVQAVIDAAHDTTGGKKRIEVHAWMVTFRTSGGAVYAAHSDTPTGSLINLDNYWPSRTSAGAETADKAFDPGHPLAEDYTVNVAMDLVNNFDLDGIHFDYIRFTGGNEGYNPTSIARYNARYGLSGQPSSTNDQFDQWRRDQVSNLVRKVYAKVQASKPSVKVSGSFVTWNPSPTASTRAAFQATRPYGNRTDGVFCDWDAMMQEGIVDLSIPMTYYDYASSPSDWTRWINFIKDRQFNRQAIIGPGIYLNSLSNAILEIQQTRTASPAGHYATGFSGYSYRVPYESGTWAGFSPTLVAQVTPTWDDIPDMPWKTNPTEGHISGTVTDAATTKWIDGATVSLTGPENRSMLTDGTGFYAFIDLTSGTYTVTVSKTGYPNSVRTVYLMIGEVTGNMYVRDIALGGTPDTTPPSVPTNLSATAVSATQVDLTWTASTDNVGVTGYKIFRDSVQIDTSATTSYSDPTCSPNTTYSYTVSAYDAAGNNSAQSAADVVTTPAGGGADLIIDNPQATFTGSWSTGTSSGDKYGADYRFITGQTGETGTAQWRPNIALAGNYDVSCWYPQGANRATAAPYIVYWNGGSQQVNMNQQSGGGTWHVLVSNKPFVTGTAGYLKLGNATGQTSLVVMADAARFFQVGGGPDTEPPTVPTNLAATAVSSSQINLTWTASTDNVAVTGYRIFRNDVEVGTSPTTSFSDPGLTQYTTYTYKVTAYDAMSNESAQSTPAGTTTWDGQAPTVPTNLSATPISSTRIDLTWTASTDNAGVTGYKVFRNSSQIGTSGDATYSDITCLPNTTYTYEVSAYDARSNESAHSAPAIATTPPGSMAEIIIDNPAAVYVGTWSTGTTATEKYGADYRFATTAVTTGRTAKFTPTIANAGGYDLYAWWSAGSNRATNAPYFCQWNGGSQTVNANQSINGGMWRSLLTNRSMAVGTAGFIRLGNGTGSTTKVVIADAVRFQQVN